MKKRETVSLTMGIMLFFVLQAARATASTMPLPRACGSDAVKFHVTRERRAPPPGLPPAGQAQIVLIEKIDYLGGYCFSGCDVTVRVGIDGKWVGADQGHFSALGGQNYSYFAANVTPGKHQICASWQSMFRRLKKNVDVVDLQARAGGRYYFVLKPIVMGDDKVSTYRLRIKRLDADMGRYLVRISAQSIFKRSQ